MHHISLWSKNKLIKFNKKILKTLFNLIEIFNKLKFQISIHLIINSNLY